MLNIKKIRYIFLKQNAGYAVISSLRSHKNNKAGKNAILQF